MIPAVSADPQVVQSIRFVAVVRLAYGVVAILAPRVWPRIFQLDPDNADARMWNGFLGSRDIALGLHSLAVANDPSRHVDVILLNEACEVGDTILNAQEVRHGRSPKSFASIAAFVFNAGMHAIWIRVLLLRRSESAHRP